MEKLDRELYAPCIDVRCACICCCFTVYKYVVRVVERGTLRESLDTVEKFRIFYAAWELCCPLVDGGIKTFKFRIVHAYYNPFRLE